MIRIKEIADKDRSSKYYLGEVLNFEYVNPIEHTFYTLLGIGSVFIENGIPQEDVFKMCKDEILKYKSISLPNCLLQLLAATSKKEQQKALKGFSLTQDELVAFSFIAFEKYGFKYSQYKTQHFHKGFDKTLLPQLLRRYDNGSIKTIGHTPLSAGQQRQVFEHRDVKVAKFFDNGDVWHCFFLTFKSLEGKERHKNGQPHLHYISDKWGISRNEVLAQLTSKDYHLPSLPHIDFYTNNKYN